MAETIVIIQCEYCGKDVEKLLYRVNYSRKNGKKLFCNQSCNMKYINKRRRDNFIMPSEKQCIDCNEIKSLCEFYPSKINLDGTINKCKICRTKYSQQQRKKREYGLTPEDEVEMRESQDGACAICERDVALCIDHNHITDVIRGLLCYKCNTALGHFNDNPYLLRKATAYLEGEFNEN